ncbi:MAG TPA: cell envelope integrity protein TolA [Nitrosospira sp.]|nr:cell envelope integrity protein TolA [Nitrosospira sp.]
MNAAVLRNSRLPEPGRIPAAVFAVLVHVAFFAFMIFGLNWKTQPPEGMMVDLWSDLPQPAPPEPVAKPVPPEPKPEPPPEPVKPVEPPPEVKPLPPRQETPPPTVKPDIAIKEKPEKPKPVVKKPVEKKLLPPKDLKELVEEAERKEQKELKELKERQQKARVAAEMEQVRREQEAKERLQAQAAARSRVSNEIDEYKARILARIKRNIVMPPDLPGNPVAEFDVTLLPGGDVLDVKLRKSSGFAAFDSAVERAIYLSKPLPLPPDPALFPQFRNLSIKVHYLE